MKIYQEIRDEFQMNSYKPLDGYYSYIAYNQDILIAVGESKGNRVNCLINPSTPGKHSKYGIAKMAVALTGISNTILFIEHANKKEAQNSERNIKAKIRNYFNISDNRKGGTWYKGEIDNKIVQFKMILELCVKNSITINPFEKDVLEMICYDGDTFNNVYQVNNTVTELINKIIR
ncbi:MAG: hypothetical protein ABIA04_15380 [Pseudomonadota bacterium]